MTSSSMWTARRTSSTWRTPTSPRGNLVRSNTNAVGETGNGVLTQVFVDTSDKDVYITVINTYVAKTGDYDDKKDEIDLEVYSIEDKNTSSRAANYVKNTDDKDDSNNKLDPYISDFTVAGDDFAIADYVGRRRGPGDRGQRRDPDSGRSRGCL